MSKRIVYRTGDVVVRYSSENQEYSVQRRGEPDGYFTTDYDDARDTANLMQKEYKENPGAKMPQIFSYNDAAEVYDNTPRGKLGPNTTIRRANDGSYVIRLYDTDIICYHPDDSVSLNSGGNRTATTRNRINAFLAPKISVRTHNEEWRVSAGGLGTSFYDGIRIYPRGEPFGHRRNPEEQRGGIHVDIHSHNPPPSHIDDAGHVHLSDEDFGVFTWREDNRYAKADSVFNSRSEKRAQNKADALNEAHPELGIHGYVVRQLKYLR